MIKMGTFTSYFLQYAVPEKVSLRSKKQRENNLKTNKPGDVMPSFILWLKPT